VVFEVLNPSHPSPELVGRAIIFIFIVADILRSAKHQADKVDEYILYS